MIDIIRIYGVYDRSVPAATTSNLYLLSDGMLCLPVVFDYLGTTAAVAVVAVCCAGGGVESGICSGKLLKGIADERVHSERWVYESGGQPDINPPVESADRTRRSSY